MVELASVRTPEDILPAWRGTPVGRLLEYHNLEQPFGEHERPELLVGMCMDSRLVLRVPRNFTFVLRTGGANLRRVEFKVSFAVAVGGIRAIALIGHDDCGMMGLGRRREAFVEGLVQVGWERAEAERHFDAYAPAFEIDDPAAFVHAEAARLRLRYPRLLVASLLYSVREGRLLQVLG